LTKKKNKKTHETSGVKDHPTISVCLIVKNEEKQLDNCLATCENISHELIVANIDLPDCTGEIATEY
jgi:glycosyltransferase involved in cell wall biosynthesis